MLNSETAASPDYLELSNGLFYDGANNYIFTELDVWETAVYLGSVYDDIEYFSTFEPSDIAAFVEEMEQEASLMGNVTGITTIRDTYL